MLLEVETAPGVWEQKDLSQPRGLIALAESLVSRKNWKTEQPLRIFTTAPDGSSVETIILFTDRDGDQHHTYINGGMVNQSSAPVVALRAAIAKGIGSAIEAHFGGLPDTVTTADLRSGVVTITKILHVDPAYDSQTKEKMVSTDLNPLISKEVSENVLQTLINDLPTLEYLKKHILLMVKAREAAREAREKALSKEEKTPITKLPTAVSLDIYTPPLSNNPKENQLFLFEGISASGTLIAAAKEKDEKGRLYKQNIGILALRGVLIGTYRNSLDKILSRSPQYAMLVEKSGLDRNNRDDLSKLKYKQFVIATDEDVGGAFIAAQLIGFFIMHFPEVIRQGKLARIRTPLYEVVAKGKPSLFIYQWEDRDAKIAEAGFDPTKAGKQFDVLRSKGLGALSENARMTLVRDQKFNVYQHDNPEALLQMLELIVGEESMNRKDILFNMVIPEEVD